jgi:hypothetical protein
MPSLPYDHVPDVEPGAEPDAHWLELKPKSWKLPEAYMPPAMSGPHEPWTRTAAWVLIAVFLGATVCGVCLTYGIIP